MYFLRSHISLNQVFQWILSRLHVLTCQKKKIVLINPKSMPFHCLLLQTQNAFIFFSQIIIFKFEIDSENGKHWGFQLKSHFSVCVLHTSAICCREGGFLSALIQNPRRKSFFIDLIFEKIKFPLTDLQICPYGHCCLSLMNAQNLSAPFCFPTDIAILINRLIFYFLM